MPQWMAVLSLAGALGGLGLAASLLGPGSEPASADSVRVTSEELHRGGGVPPGWKFRVPAGDPAQGKQLFATLECYACHEVTGAGFPPKANDKSGPNLTRMGGHHPAEYFAESILDPNAVIIEAPGFYGKDGRSTMPSYNDSLTLEQWIHLVAYLKSLTGADPHAGHHAGHQPPAKEPAEPSHSDHARSGATTAQTHAGHEDSGATSAAEGHTGHDTHARHDRPSPKTPSDDSAGDSASTGVSTERESHHPEAAHAEHAKASPRDPGGPGASDGHDAHAAHEAQDSTRDKTVAEYRLRLDYVEPREATLPGDLRVYISDAQSGHPVPYLPVRVRLDAGKPRPLKPAIGADGPYYGASVRVPDQTETITVLVGAATVAVTPPAPARYRTPRQATFEW
jgi:hypothetical protein